MKTKQTKSEALSDIIGKAEGDRCTKAGLRRMNRAARTLELTNGETVAMLQRARRARYT